MISRWRGLGLHAGSTDPHVGAARGPDRTAAIAPSGGLWVGEGRGGEAGGVVGARARPGLLRGARPRRGPSPGAGAVPGAAPPRPPLGQPRRAGASGTGGGGEDVVGGGGGGRGDGGGPAAPAPARVPHPRPALAGQRGEPAGERGRAQRPPPSPSLPPPGLGAPGGWEPSLWSGPGWLGEAPAAGFGAELLLLLGSVPRLWALSLAPAGIRG